VQQRRFGAKFFTCGKIGRRASHGKNGKIIEEERWDA